MVWGLPVYIFLKRRGTESYWYTNGINTLIFLFFSGLFSLAVISSWLVLLIPLRFSYLFSATVILLVILLFYFRSSIAELYSNLKTKKRNHILQSVFIFSCILLFIVLGSLKAVNIDTQLYHLQIIRWTNEYGVVPGLANLYPRLGLGSNWFNLISLFHIPAFNHQNFTFLNTTTTIWFLLWLMNKWRYYYTLQNNQSYSRVFALFYFLVIIYFLYDWQLFRDTANSTSYDFIITALTIAVISFIAEELFSDKKNKLSIVLIILSFLVVPFKLSGIFILIPVFLYFLNFRESGAWIKLLFAGLLILFPLLARNYFITGYPLYPSTLSVGSPEWQMPRGMVKSLQEHIIYVNKFYNHQVYLILGYEKTTFNWIPTWFESILLRHKILLYLSGLSFSIFFYTPIAQSNHKKIRLFIISLWLMVAGWFFTAPDPRFAFGVLLFLAFFPIALFINKSISFNKIYNPAFALITLAVLVYAVKKSEPLLKQSSNLYHVADTDVPSYQTKMVNNTSFNVSEKIHDNWNNRCFFIPLPCLCEENPFLQQRNNNTKKGFMMKPLPDSIFIRNYNY
jgi:hypothetical protein